METQQLTQIIKQELPEILRQDQEMRQWVIELTQKRYADKEETESRFDRILDELRRDREAQSRKWEEQNRKWDENQAVIKAMLQDIQALSRKHDNTIGALGARWGLYTEQSFRNALKGILTGSFDVEVLHVTEFDDEGEVFGRPDQIELDIIILNGTLILAEIKSSMSKSDMYAFERKARFYEKQHKRKADRLLVISPMVDDKVRAVAQKLGIEVYSYAEDVPPELFALN
ncbi:MAG: DUF3782 domain-containing protein [Chloroflexi bacterium]|nr:DUF3782 domain-containing protein [Chloroflexota bacterium]